MTAVSFVVSGHSRNLLVEFSLAFVAEKFWVSTADFFKSRAVTSSDFSSFPGSLARFRGDKPPSCEIFRPGTGNR